MARIRGRAFQDPDEKLVKDLDPEANGHQSDGSSDNDSGDDGNAGTEHYVAVGKSRLREKEGLSLGRSYRGSRVSRQALEEESEEDEDDDEEEEEDDDDDDEDEEDDEEFDDPETADLEADTAQAGDSEIESDEALADSDSEQLKDFVFRGSSKPKTRKRATAADYMSSSGGEEEEEEAGGAGVDGSEEDEDEDEEMDDGLEALIDGIASEDEEDEEDEDEDDEEEDDDDEDEEEEEEEEDEEDDDEDEDEEDDEEEEDAKQDAKPAAAAPSNQSEAEKGLAILEQRKIYDGLLNMRIRLQKALVATNTLPTLEDSAPSEAEAYSAAESAAIKLLNTMSGLRQNLTPASAAAGLKRKRDALSVSASTAEIWARLQQEDADAARFRQDRLEKWSRKVQSVNVAAAKLGAPKQRTLVGALQEQLAAPGARLARRTQVPRSCAPVQAAARVAESAAIYDDADFYQLLLKELVDQRTVESAAEQSGAVASVMVTANKEARMRKAVDRKASKGRKMRFTVHEKLQNFMAPEDRRAWEQEAIDRFFGTLLGQKMELNEEEEEKDGEEDEEAAALYSAESGLRLFR